MDTIPEHLLKNPEELVKKIIQENNNLKSELSSALFKIEEQKLVVQKRTLGKIKKLEGDLKKHTLLEENWKKSKEALLKENKSLLDELNKVQNQMKEVKKKHNGNVKKKLRQLKEKLVEKGVKISKKSIEKLDEIVEENEENESSSDNIKRSVSAVNLKGRKSDKILGKKRQNSEKILKVKKETLRNESLFHKYNKNLASNQRKLQKKLKESNENLINVYVRQINELQTVIFILFLAYQKTKFFNYFLEIGWF